MPHKQNFAYATAFKNSLSPCPVKKGGGHSLFEMYHGLRSKITPKTGGRRVSNRSKRKQKGGNQFPKNPPYMMTTAPHKPGVRNLVAPTDLPLYERSFQGPFPSRSGVNFKLDTPFKSNNLLVEPVPMNGGKKKKIVRKTSKKVVRKTSKKVVRKTSKKVVRKASKKIVRKASKKIVRKASKKGGKKKVVRKASKKGARKRVMKGG
jgi:hypothetical protein